MRKEKELKEHKQMNTKKIDRLSLHNAAVAIKAHALVLKKSDKLISKLVNEVETLQYREEAYANVFNDYEEECRRLSRVANKLEAKIAELNSQVLELQNKANKRSESMQDYMSRKKENMEKFTHSIYGWEVNEKQELVPNWEQQEIISSMRDMLANDTSASKVAKILNEIGISGSRGGTWTSSSVLRTVRGKFHKNLDKFTPPE